MKRSTLQLSLFFFLFVILINTRNLSKVVISNYSSLPISYENYNFTTNEQIHDEAYVDYGGAQLSGGPFPKGSTIHVNYTVLPQSNGSVEFTFYYSYLDYATWLPVPPNFTLAIGESYAGIFTLNRTINQNTLLFLYDVCTTIFGEDATVHWWYEVLVTGKTSAVSFFVVGTTLFVIAAISVFHSKRKTIKK